MQFLIIGFYYLMQIYLGLMILSIVLTWIPFAYNLKIFRLIGKIADGYLGLFRGYITIGIFDFTPVVGILIYEGLMYAFSYLISLS